MSLKLDIQLLHSVIIKGKSLDIKDFEGKIMADCKIPYFLALARWVGLV